MSDGITAPPPTAYSSCLWYQLRAQLAAHCGVHWCAPPPPGRVFCGAPVSSPVYVQRMWGSVHCEAA